MKWFVSDTHFEWPSIAQTRGLSMEDHDEMVLQSINRHVDRKHTLYILGDFCRRNAAKWRMRIKCSRVILIYGNHDKRSWGQYFIHAYEQRVVKVGGQMDVFLSHYPTAYWPGSHRGWGHLYGHTHQQREETLDQLFPGRRSMDVGVDALIKRFGEFRPINEFEVLYDFQLQPGHDNRDFYTERFGLWSAQ